MRKPIDVFVDAARAVELQYEFDAYLDSQFANDEYGMAASELLKRKDDGATYEKLYNEWLQVRGMA